MKTLTSCVKKLITTSSLIFSVFFATAQHKPLGTYRSNFADLGFFITKIDFKSDSTFTYHFSGDLLHDSSQGIFTIRKDTIFLHFVDTVTSTLLNDSLASIAEKISSGRHMRPAKYLFRNNKLWSFHVETGKVVKNAISYHKTKRYIFFGSHYYKRERYLRKVD